ncbi:hypothetical protein ACI7RC_14520 [Brevibacillus sp. B_LB10_24]|uniref:YkvI family membrane protein n=1 Tax=Brevibacillus sp. B_LB10_24 TaxID=3380645 RepID=UPI0038B8460B
MRQSLQIAGAFVGLIVGAGFASGQEVLQFFTSFGLAGMAGTLIATALFAFLGMQIAQLGNRLQTKSHKEVINHICGRYLGIAVDIVITFFLFGVTVVMMAGSGSLFEQQFGMPSYLGSIFMVVVTILTVCLNIRKIITLMGMFTPVLMAVVVILAIYSLSSMDASFSELNQFADPQAAAASNWALGSFLYVSYNIAAGVAMLAVISTTAKNSKQAGMGGLLGGLGLGLLIILINLGIFSKFDQVKDVDLPTLALAGHISPLLSGIMSIVLLGMIYNTAVGMLYSFTVRFVQPEHPRFKLSIIGFGILSFVASLAGFTKLVGTVYPLMGYLGFVLIAATVVAWFRGRAAKQTGQTGAL